MMFSNSLKAATLVDHLRVCGNLTSRMRPTFCAQISFRHCSGAFATTATEKLVVEPRAKSFSLDSTCELLRTKIRSTHGSKFDYSFDNVRSIVECLTTEDVDEARIVELFVKQPELCNSHGRDWQSILLALHENGLSMSSIVEMLMACPQLLRTSPEKLHEAFNCLREHGFADKHLVSVISNAPLLLVTNPKFIAEQIQRLMTMFTHKDILKLAINCPNVLFDDFDDTEEKVQHIVHEIGVDQKQIVSSRALAHSLYHIQLRHQIMIRTGVYRKPHPKKKIENVDLSVMVDTSAKEFTDKIVGISLEELSVFERMFAREMDKRRNQTESPESDSEEELSKNYK